MVGMMSIITPQYMDAQRAQLVRGSRWTVVNCSHSGQWSTKVVIDYNALSNWSVLIRL